MENNNFIPGGAINYPKERLSLMDAGIGLFEVRRKKRPGNDWPDQLWGFFDARATDIDAPMQPGRSFYQMEWRTKGDAYIKFEYDKNSNGIAWVPDDKFWHNRFLLMRADMGVANLHTKQGIINGETINKELICLRDYCLIETPIWHLLRNGKKISSNFDEAAINGEKELEESKTSGANIGGDMKITMRPSLKFKYTIVKETQLREKPEILEMIEKYRHKKRFGWTECEEFQAIIKPAVLKLINIRRGEAMGAASKMSAEALGGQFTAAEVLKLRSFLGDTQPVESKELYEEAKVDGDYLKPRYLGYYKKLKAEDLEKTLMARNIEYEGLARGEMIELLVEWDEEQKNKKENVT